MEKKSWYQGIQYYKVVICMCFNEQKHFVQILDK